MKRDLAPPADGSLLVPAGVISAVRAADTTGKRFEVRVGDAVATVSAGLIAEFHLAAGRTIAPADAEALSRAVGRLRVFDRAVGLLALRARSARDLRTALRRRGATASDSQSVIEELVGLGLLDDQAYARAVAHGRATATGMSRRRVTQVLARKGVDPRVADEAAREAFEGVDETEAALQVAAKRLRSLEKLDDAVRRRRLHAFLARRGFSSEVVRRVLARLLRGSQED